MPEPRTRPKPEPTFQTEAVAPSPVTVLPAGYPAYCIFVPSGMNQSLEAPLWTTLQGWGQDLGQNLLVAQWSIGDPSYVKLISAIGAGPAPVVILTDSPNIGPQSMFVRISDPRVLGDLDTIKQALPLILNRILLGDDAAAVKAATQAQRVNDLKATLREVGGILSKLKISFSYGGVTVSVGG